MIVVFVALNALSTAPPGPDGHRNLDLATPAVGVAPGFRPLALPPVLLFTVLGVAGATVVYWLLHRRAANPDRTGVPVIAPTRKTGR